MTKELVREIARKVPPHSLEHTSRRRDDWEPPEQRVKIENDGCDGAAEL